MSTEKAGVDTTSTDVGHDHRLQPIETNDDIAPEIIGMALRIVAATHVLMP